MEDAIERAIRVFPLGGLGEVGMNCLAIEQRGEILLVDCGVTFDDRGIGVDVIHPDFSALDPYRDRIKGVFVTHGHEDHIGALPYLLRRFLVPIWAGPYALGLIRERLSEHEVLEHATLLEAKPRTVYDVGSFKVEPIRVTHSIADATALAITTDAGVVLHSGDFKIDDSPADGERFDEERLRELGDAGVRLLFSDSTNVDSDGTAGSETSVREALEPLIASATGAVVVALFASNVHRLRLLGEIAKATGRRIVPLGRSIHTHSKVAHATGYLDWPSDLVWPAERVRELPRHKILGLATGSQAEARAALARLAHGEHPNMELLPGEMVVLSSRIIPGNEREVYALMGALLRRGVDVRSRVTDRGIHVSGHAHRGEQRKMIELVRPRSFIPVHGTIHHLTRHAELARTVGVADAAVIQNGDVAELREDSDVARSGHVHSGRVHVFAGRAISPRVLKEREAIASTGVAFVSIVVDVLGKRVHDVLVDTRGILDPDAAPHLLAAAVNDVRAALEEAFARGDGESTLPDTARYAARRSFFKALGSKPNTVVTMHRTHVAPGKA